MARPKGSKKGQLTPKQKQFIYNLCDTNSETYGNQTQSYKKAYNCIKSTNKVIQSSASILANKPIILKAITNYKPAKPENLARKREISKDYALSCLQETYDSCFKIDDEKRVCIDRSTAASLVRLMMQYNNMLSERLVVTSDDPLSISEAVRAKALQEAHKLLLEGDITEALTEDDDNTIDAEFVDETGDSGPSTDSQQIDDSFLIDDN